MKMINRICKKCDHVFHSLRDDPKCPECKCNSRKMTIEERAEYGTTGKVTTRNYKVVRNGIELKARAF